MKMADTEEQQLNDERSLPERDYVTFGYLPSQFRLSSVIRLSVVCNVRAPYSADCNFW